MEEKNKGVNKSYSLKKQTNKQTVYLILELGVGIDSVHLPGLGKKSSKGESEPKSQEP